jgi:mannose-6-phosphate isomerase-like protein (cupin superfamily)
MFTVVRKSKESKHIIKKLSEEEHSFTEIVDMNERVSVDVAEVVDHHEKIKTAYNRIYYIFEGTMRIWINNQEMVLQKGDACFVEKGMIVEIRGTFSVILVGQPILRL